MPRVERHPRPLSVRTRMQRSERGPTLAQILNRTPRADGVSEVTLSDGSNRLTVTVTDSMLDSEMADKFLESIMDAERRRIKTAKRALAGGDDA
jgi:hypothetical protein